MRCETYRQVEHTGTGEQKTVWERPDRSGRACGPKISGNALERQTEQTKPMSTMFLWQKHAARKSILSCVGTASTARTAGGGRNDICVCGAV